MFTPLEVLAQKNFKKFFCELSNGGIKTALFITNMRKAALIPTSNVVWIKKLSKYVTFATLIKCGKLLNWSSQTKKGRELVWIFS